MGITGDICKRCSQIIQWREDQKKYEDTEDEEYDYSSPCAYCALNNIGY